MLVRGFDFGRTPEVTWGDVRAPLKDRLDQLSGETSGRIELGSGTTTFTVKIPSGARAATAAKPSWRGEAGGGAGVQGEGCPDVTVDAGADGVPQEKTEVISGQVGEGFPGISRDAPSPPSTSGRNQDSDDMGDGRPSRRSARRPTRAPDNSQEPQQLEEQQKPSIQERPTAANEDGFTVRDTCRNTGSGTSDLEMLYHINIGLPFLEAGSKVKVPFCKLVPRTPDAAAALDDWDTYGEPQPGPEHVYFFSLYADDANQSEVLLTNAAADMGVASSFRLPPGGAPAAKNCAGSPGSAWTFGASTPESPICAGPFAAVSIPDIEGSLSTSDTHDIMSSKSSESDIHDTMSASSCSNGEGSGIGASSASSAAPPAGASGARGVRTAASSSPTISSGS